MPVSIFARKLKYLNTRKNYLALSGGLIYTFIALDISRFLAPTKPSKWPRAEEGTVINTFGECNNDFIANSKYRTFWDDAFFDLLYYLMSIPLGH